MFKLWTELCIKYVITCQLLTGECSLLASTVAVKNAICYLKATYKIDLKKPQKTVCHVIVSPPLWTCSAVRRLPSGGSTGCGICSIWGRTEGFGWHLRAGGRAPHGIPAPRSPAWWNGRGGGSRMAGSAGTLSAYWLEGCSAAGWPPKPQVDRCSVLPYQ